MRINRKIVVTHDIRTSKDGKYCGDLCEFSNDTFCDLYGDLKWIDMSPNIRHKNCIKDEVGEDYYRGKK